MKKNAEAGNKFSELLDLIARLRAPGGCPWDQKQTVQSFKPYLIEETHELSEALEGSDPLQVREELGDMYFQIGFINQLYEEQDHFTICEVLQSIIDKMIRRHPHVFADTTFDSYEEMRRNWGKVKEKEKNAKKSRENELDVPKSLPALIRAQRVTSRVTRRGFDWPDMAGIVAKLDEEQKELMDAITTADKSRIKEELGDFLFLLTHLAGKFDLAAEECLHAATNKFVHRFKFMEEIITKESIIMETLDTDSLLSYWRIAKKSKTEQNGE
ncbi:MAG: nucleoside triphosphate pyrophosphohydrolase [Pseudomonadota bacterium]